jgi:hypothetical protein
MHIHQLSVTYQAEQDRFLLRVSNTGGEEMRLWLTRRLMLGLWPVLDRLQADQVLNAEPGGAALAGADQELRRMLAEFRKEEVLQRADFDTPFEEKSTLPLGPAPLLVTDVDANPLANGRLRLAFNERADASEDAAPRAFQLELDTGLTQGLVHLLEQALARSGWREPFAGAPGPLPAEADGLGEAAEPRPRYLN